MRERRSGVILNISSIAAVCAVPMAAYKISKAGVNALTQALAMDNAGHGIRANAIMPGLIDTPMAIEGSSSPSTAAHAAESAESSGHGVSREIVWVHTAAITLSSADSAISCPEHSAPSAILGGCPLRRQLPKPRLSSIAPAPCSGHRRRRCRR
jgi:NAD(P)-dependent dehydrogenase (short-subunit alcohol dehydrogenase family)